MGRAEIVPVPPGPERFNPGVSQSSPLASVRAQAHPPLPTPPHLPTTSAGAWVLVGSDGGRVLETATRRGHRARLSTAPKPWVAVVPAGSPWPRGEKTTGKNERTHPAGASTGSLRALPQTGPWTSGPWYLERWGTGQDGGLCIYPPTSFFWFNLHLLFVGFWLCCMAYRILVPGD